MEKTATNPLGVPPARLHPKPSGSVKMSDPQRAALVWLKNRNGSGAFEKKPASVLVAGGQRAPIMRATWVRLAVLGCLHIEGKRVTLTELGRNEAVGPEASGEYEDFASVNDT